MKLQLINHLGAHDEEVQKMFEVLPQYDARISADYEWTPCEIKFNPGATVPDAGYIAHGIFLNPDQAGALGYHALDSRGMPYGKSFFNVVPNKVLLHDPTGHGGSLAGVVTHEFAEIRGDRFANVWANGKIINPAKTRQSYGLIAFELCDPCQDTSFLLPSKDGTPVDCSDYVKPNYFNPDTPKSEATSQTGVLLGPMVVGPGGYAIVAQSSGETQIFGRRIGKKELRIFHKETPPPAWREEMRALKYSRSNLRAGVSG